MTTFVRVEVHGMRQLRRHLRADVFYAEAWRDALLRAAEYAEGALRRMAPRRTGNLVSSFTRKLSSAKAPTWAVVRVGARGHKNFRYPYALDASKKGPKWLYRYRSGPMAGQRTFGWFHATFRQSQAAINTILERALDEIDASWAKP